MADGSKPVEGYTSYDGILDHCSCGAHVEMEQWSVGLYRVKCQACESIITIENDKTAAMVDWNRLQRQ
jgi:hypothetical protein